MTEFTPCGSCAIDQFGRIVPCRLHSSAPDLLAALEGFITDYDAIRAGSIADVSAVMQKHLSEFRTATLKAKGE